MLSSSVQKKPSLNQRRRLFSLGMLWHWWISGLLACLPGFLRRWFVATPTRLVFDILDGNALLLRKEGAENEELGRYYLQALAESSLLEQLGKAKNKLKVLRLPSGKVLAKTLTLPMAAETNLRQIIGFDLDRLTPFAPDKIYYDIHILSRHPETRRIQVRFVAVLRTVVNGYLECLAEINVVPDAVEAAGEADINLLPVERQPQPSRLIQRTQWALVGLCLLLTAAAFAVPLLQQRQLVIELMPKVATVQKQAEAVIALRDELDQALASSHFLIEKHQQRAAALDIINELTSLLPDGTWVEHLIIKEGEIQIRGQSQEASALIALVEGSTYFSNATFRSPVIADRRTGRDRFFLSALIAKEVS